MAIPDIQEALDLIEGGRPEEAVALLTAWAEQMPAHVAVQVALARAYEAAAQRPQARAAWHRAHFLMPNSPAARDGLHRALAPSAPDDDRLVMDLDLQAELDAALETLFNPFTLPQQADAEAEAPPEEEDAALAQVEAALAIEEAAAVEDAPPEPAETETAPADARSIYEEIEQLIEEKERQSHTQAATGEAAAPAEEAAPEASAEPAPEAAAGLDVAGWQEFEAAPDAPTPPAPDAGVDDLERLIEELEAARIVPRPDLDDAPPPDLDDDIDDVVSETLARIYASQRKYAEAARVYEQLARQQPDQATRFLQQAAEMRAHDDDASD